MKKQKLSTKIAKFQFSGWIPLVILILLLFFIFDSKLTNSETHVELSQVDSSEYNPDGTLDYSITFLEFGAKGCKACKKMEAVLEEIREELSNVKVIFYNVTTDKGKLIANQFDIQMIPVQILLDNTGKEVYRHTGFISANELKKEIFKHE